MKKSAMVFVVSLVAPSVLAWHDTGHMVIASIAYPRLSAAAKTQVDRLLKIPLVGDPEKYDFVSASCWADDLKRKIKDHRYDAWHYIDLPFSADGTPGLQPDKENVVWAINQAMATLKNPNSPDLEKARQLRFLLHFAGDVYMPLHCVSRFSKAHPKGDRGGNDFPIQWNNRRTNLHFFWDTAAGLFKEVKRPMMQEDQTLISNWAKQITASYPPSKFKEVSDMDVSHWAKEGLVACKTFVYSLPEGQNP